MRWRVLELTGCPRSTTSTVDGAQSQSTATFSTSRWPYGSSGACFTIKGSCYDYPAIIPASSRTVGSLVATVRGVDHAVRRLSRIPEHARPARTNRGHGEDAEANNSGTIDDSLRSDSGCVPVVPPASRARGPVGGGPRDFNRAGERERGGSGGSFPEGSRRAPIWPVAHLRATGSDLSPGGVAGFAGLGGISTTRSHKNLFFLTGMSYGNPAGAREPRNARLLG